MTDTSTQVAKPRHVDATRINHVYEEHKGVSPPFLQRWCDGKRLFNYDIDVSPGAIKRVRRWCVVCREHPEVRKAGAA